MIEEYKIFNNDLSEINFTKKNIVNCINPHAFCVANQDYKFKDALLSSDILLPDGIGIVWAESFLNSKKIKKIAGYDIFKFIMNDLNFKNGSVFFLGSTESTLEKIKIRCNTDYPNIKFGSHSPPFKPNFDNDDSFLMCKKVNDFNPDVLFVGMTAPKQEKWVHENKNQLKVNTICSVGAVFDFYSGNINRAPKFLINIGLEWLHRSLKSRRLFIRNFISNPKFIFQIIKIKFRRILS